jgi:Zn-dependent protease with chaperone function
MVMAHEIAHIHHRDPIVALGRGFTVLLAISSLTGMGDDLMQKWVGDMSSITMLSFSRTQEMDADKEALQGVLRHYGYVDGASAFFEYAATQPQVFSSLLSTHPSIGDRITQIRQFQQAHAGAGTHVLRPLPGFLKLPESRQR